MGIKHIVIATLSVWLMIMGASIWFAPKPPMRITKIIPRVEYIEEEIVIEDPETLESMLEVEEVSEDVLQDEL